MGDSGDLGLNHSSTTYWFDRCDLKHITETVRAWSLLLKKGSPGVAMRNFLVPDIVAPIDGQTKQSLLIGITVMDSTCPS